MTARNYDFWFDHMSSSIDSGMAYIREYLRTFEAHLTLMMKAYDNRVAEYHAEASDDEYGDHAEQLHDEAMQLDVFETLLRNSTLVSIVTYFESQAVRFSRADFRTRKKSDYKKLGDLEAAAKQAVQRFDRLADYWKTNGLTFHKTTLWNEISLIGKVRNKVAHTNGELGDDSDTESKAIRDYVARRHKSGNVSLEIDEDVIKVKPEYCLEVIGVYRRFLLELLKAISDIK